jgi:hypothetical protein
MPIHPAEEHRRPPCAASGPPRGDWTALVLLASAVTLAAVTATWVIERIDERHAAVEAEPGPERGERGAPSEVDLWVGEVRPGVKGVLTGVWGDALPDRAHDDELRASLQLAPGSALAWYRLLLFNLSGEPRTVPLVDGSLVVDTHEGHARLTSLAALVERGVARPSPSLATVLKGLGALRADVTLAPGEAATVLVCFDRRLDLGGAHTTVATADGSAFRRRRMGRGDLQRLMADPDASEVSLL